MKRLLIQLRQRLPTLPVAALLVLCESPAQAFCDESWLQFDQVRQGSSVAVYATNRLDVPVTFCLVFGHSTADRTGRDAVSDTLAALERRKIHERPAASDQDLPAHDVACELSIGSRHAAHDDDYLYRLPYADGMSFRVLQGFNSSWSHRGIEQFAIDFRMPEGTPVHAARGGVVARVEEEWDVGCWREECSNFANFVVILHDDGTTGEYYHLQQDGALVDVGDVVSPGQQIGISGNTGRTVAPHLHFAVYRATNGGGSQSLPVNFISADGIVHKPRNGHYYFAVGGRSVGD